MNIAVLINSHTVERFVIFFHFSVNMNYIEKNFSFTHGYWLDKAICYQRTVFTFKIITTTQTSQISLTKHLRRFWPDSTHRS